MRFLRKYLVGYRMALSRELVYRVNFFFGQLRLFIFFATLLFLTLSLPGGIAGYTQEELTAYYVISTGVTALIFVFVMENISNEIADGDLTNYLLRPVHYFAFWASRAAATRTLVLLSIVVQLFFLTRIPGVDLFVQTDPAAFGMFIVLLLGAIILVQLLDFAVALIAFWANRAFGPRWLLVNLVYFFTGAFLPIEILPAWAKTLFFATPFPSMIYLPVSAYLGKLDTTAFFHALTVQWIWIIVFAVTLTVLWRAGTKTYEAYGR